MGQVQAVWHTSGILTRSPPVLVHVREDHIKEHTSSELLYTPFPLSPAASPPQVCVCGGRRLHPGRGFLQPGRGFLKPGCGFLQPRLVAI